MMLTSFFGKSSPINYLLLSIFLVLFCVLHAIIQENALQDLVAAFQLIAIAVLLVFSLLLLDFFVRKNHLNQSHTFAIFLFACLAGMLPVTGDVTRVGSLVFQLLALRRIFSIASAKNTEKKVLDASLWIFLASYFYFWSLLLLVLVYLALFNLKMTKPRYYLIPFIGALGIFLLATAFFFLKEDSFAWFYGYPEQISLDFSAYGSIPNLLFITLVMSLVIWTGLIRISNLSEVAKKNRPNHILVLHAVWVSLLVVAFAENKTGSEWLFITAPVAILIGAYMEKKQDLWFKELLAWVFLMLPGVLFFV